MLPIGTVIQLSDPERKVRMHTRLLGWREGESILLEQPVRNGQGVRLNPNTPLIGRGVHEGRVWGFRSVVTHQSFQPFRILFIKFPEQMEEVALRKAERFHMKIDSIISSRKMDYANLKKDATAPHCEIRNFSSGGCNFSSSYRFEINMPVFLSFELPTGGKSVENLMGYVRSVVRDQGENVYGVEFDARSPSIAEFHEFVNMAINIRKNAVLASPLPVSVN
ncbi:MAG: flagellar brake protein [bacterium]|nr:flagellar brake protein [bacterium]